MPTTKEKYNAIARFYDIYEKIPEKLLFSKWRTRYLSKLKGKILEVGIGTGKSLDYYNDKARVIGIDFSEEMLKKAKQKLKKLGKKNIILKQGDVENLKFKSNSFNYVVTFFVFCSVSDPVKGLKEIKRVLKPRGKAIFIEHVLSKNKFIAFFQHLFNPLSRALSGVNINRNTKLNILKAGLRIEKEKNLALGDIFKLFVAKK